MNQASWHVRPRFAGLRSLAIATCRLSTDAAVHLQSNGNSITITTTERITCSSTFASFLLFHEWLFRPTKVCKAFQIARFLSIQSIASHRVKQSFLPRMENQYWWNVRRISCRVYMVSASVYVSVYESVYVSAYVSVYICVPLCERLCERLCVRLCVRLCERLCERLHVSVYVSIRPCVYTCKLLCECLSMWIVSLYERFRAYSSEYGSVYVSV